jgi:lysozyme
MNQLGKSAIGVTLAGILAVATYIGTGDDFVVHHEGEVRTTYLDPVGIPTICNGHTGAGVKLGTATAEICKELRGKDLAVAFEAIEKHVRVPLTNERGLALLSFVFNFGETKFRKSTLLRQLNAGNTRESCDEFLRWINAGGKPLHGLVIRRADERALCLIGTY